METKVYAINLNGIRENKEKSQNMSDVRFIEIAETQGNVWSLKGFEAAFNNNDRIYTENMVIRMIKWTEPALQ